MKKGVIHIFITTLFLFSVFIVGPKTLKAEGKSILQTLSGEQKTCRYVKDGLYKPFSNISTDFVLFKDILNLKTKGSNKSKTECLVIAGSTDRFLFMIFRLFIGFSSVLAVVYIAIAGIGLIIEEADPNKRIKARQMLKNALIGLLLSVGAWVILYTINNRIFDLQISSALENTGFEKVIALGTQDAKNAIAVVEQNKLIAEANSLVPSAYEDRANINMYEGAALNPDGTIKPPATTVFGYRDGNGVNGREGDSGIGNGVLSPKPGYTTYNGNPNTVGVANTEAKLISEFGSLSAAKNSAYAIFKDGKYVATVPIVDTSEVNFDLSYGFAKQYIDPTIQDSNSMKNGSGITYKPLPNFYITNERPLNYYIQDKEITVNRGDKVQTVPIHKALPSEIDTAIKQGQVKVLYE